MTISEPYTLVGPNVTRPVQDPLAVLLLDNRLYMQHIVYFYFAPFETKLNSHNIMLKICAEIL